MTTDPKERARQKAQRDERKELVEKQIAEVLSNVSVAIPEVLVRPHPLVAETMRFCGRVPKLISRYQKQGYRAWLDAKHQDRPPSAQHGRYDFFREGLLNITASLESMDWILRFHDALLKALAAAAGTRKIEVQHFQSVASAVLDRKRIHLKYWNRQKQEASERLVSPLQLVHYRENWLLDAWCHKQEALRSFAVEAIFLSHIKAEVAVTLQMLGDVQRRSELLGKRVAAKDLENCLEDGVSIFEAAMRALVRRALSKNGEAAEDIERRITKLGNAFQNIGRTRHQMAELFAVTVPEDGAWGVLATAFEKRHPITHNLGVVDRKYLERAKAAERHGREIRILATEIEQMLAAMSEAIAFVHGSLFPVQLPPADDDRSVISAPQVE